MHGSLIRLMSRDEDVMKNKHMLNKREEDIDIVKGVAIVLMVILHALGPLWDGFAKFVCMFHMPVFFIAGGLFFKPEKIESAVGFINFVKSRGIRLWWPLVFWTAIFALCHNCFISLHIYSDDPQFLSYCIGKLNAVQHRYDAGAILTMMLKAPLGFAQSQLLGPMWFLRTLFFSVVIYAFIWFGAIHLIYNLKLRIIFVSFFVIGVSLFVNITEGRIFTLVFAWLGGRVLGVGCLMLHLGWCLAFTLKALRRGGIVFDVLLFGLSLAILALLYHVCRSLGCYVKLNDNIYPSILFVSCTSIVGFLMLFAFGRIFARSILGDVLSYIGQSTMPILILHLLCFKIVSSLGVMMLQMPSCAIALYPTSFVGLNWTFAYTIIGLVTPLMLNILYQKATRWIWHRDNTISGAQ